jgi:hypothetical protein
MSENPSEPSAEHPSARHPGRFYVVWSPQGGPPVKRYPEFQTARHAAWRLSQKHPVQDFFVLCSCWGKLATTPIAMTENTHPETDPGV